MTTLDELFSGDDSRAEAALTALAADDLPALEIALASGDSEKRWWAVRGLAVLAALPQHGERAVAALISTAVDADEDVRAAALHALGEAKAAEAITPLLFALGDSSSYLARIATDSLTHIGKPAVPGLIRALQEDAQPQVRANAARALAFIGDTAAIPALFRALEDDSMLVQHWADEGLERMGVGQVYFKP